MTSPEGKELKSVISGRAVKILLSYKAIDNLCAENKVDVLAAAGMNTNIGVIHSSEVSEYQRAAYGAIRNGAYNPNSVKDYTRLKLAKTFNGLKMPRGNQKR